MNVITFILLLVAEITPEIFLLISAIKAHDIWAIIGIMFAIISSFIQMLF